MQVGDDHGAAAPGVLLYDSDVVATGDVSSAGIGFSGGGVMSLGPNSALVIRRTSATAAQLGAVLLQGSVKATGKAGGTRFTLGTPFGYAELGGGDGDTEVTVSGQEGLKVLLGAIEVVGADGKRTRLDAGAGFDKQGRLLAAKAQTLSAPVAMTVVLLANPAQVQVRGQGEQEWRATERKADLKSGDAVRTRRANGTRMNLGEHAGVALQPDSEIKVVDAAREQNTEKAHYELTSGNAVFSSDRKGDASATHAVKLANQEVTIEPGVAAANVEVHTAPSGKSIISVRQGRATLANGTVVEPGTALSIDSDGTLAARPLANTKIDLRAGAHAFVYHAGTVPALKLSFASGAVGPPYEVQIANDRSFNEVVWHEKLSQPDVVTDQFRNGRYFWRVRSEKGWKEGSFSIERGRENECRSCKHSNIIDDTGENTVVYFQKTLPSITLRWPENTEAKKYRVKLFLAGSLDTPIIDQTQTDTNLTLAPGRLSENSYVWLVQALDESGKEVAAGRINALDIAYDNAVVDLQIRTPSRKTTVKTSSLVTTGETRLGSRLWINGESIALDKKGRFHHTVTLGKGDNQLIYRTTATNGVERYYIRQVTRK